MIKLLNKKVILDACCGAKMFWFEKNHPAVIYADIRKESHVLSDGRIIEINPDIQMDFRNMPFPDNSFKMVVFDPPHLEKLGKTSWLAKKYGVLYPNWEHDIKQGFNECMRVLEPYGVLIFKWSEIQIPCKKILSIIGKMPLFGHRTDKKKYTTWMVFMKFPEDYNLKL